MFNCKFCGTYKNNEDMAISHAGMCRACYADIIWYTRVMNNGHVNDFDRKNKVERICKSNLLSKRYVPNIFLVHKMPTDKPVVINNPIDCPACGSKGVEPDKHRRKRCKNCALIESRYIRHLNALQWGKITAKGMKQLTEATELFHERYEKGLEVPKAFRQLNNKW